MFKNKQNRKIDLSQLQYMTEEDLTANRVTLNNIRNNYPHTKKSDLEAYKLLYALNFKNLNEYEKMSLESIIKTLIEREDEKIKLALKYIEECQNQK